ncbi:MIEF1 upstream ORF protein-like [Homarus americanus]|uniref:MIEF1 upstream ORF protein-like n=1 Tax=Homarus americanus TaxID=6706 RepID=A0A8J5MQ48_HOMAM|nr:MIEF1 upstream ORF protein-like [Homarus americanus]
MNRAGIMGGPTRQQVLQLYRALLTYGRTLELTDQDYFYRHIRKEFQRNKSLVSPKQREFYFDKGSGEALVAILVDGGDVGDQHAAASRHNGLREPQTPTEPTWRPTNT